MPFETKGDSGAVKKGHADREPNESHHARQPGRQLVDRTLQKYPPAVGKNNSSKYRRNVRRAWEGRRLEPKPVLDHRVPDERRDGKDKTDPEPIAKHLHAVTGMLVVTIMICRARGRRTSVVVVVIRA